MPHYDYRCEACGHTMEYWQSFKDKALIECPECHKDELIRLFGIPFIFVQGEPKTLEHQADRNTKRFGLAECQEREGKAAERVAKKTGKPLKKEPQVPFWRNGSVDGLIKSETPLKHEQVNKYVEELKSLGSNIDLEKGKNDTSK